MQKATWYRARHFALSPIFERAMSKEKLALLQGSGYVVDEIVMLSTSEYQALLDQLEEANQTISKLQASAMRRAQVE